MGERSERWDAEKGLSDEKMDEFKSLCGKAQKNMRIGRIFMDIIIPVMMIGVVILMMALSIASQTDEGAWLLQPVGADDIIVYGAIVLGIIGFLILFGKMMLK